LPAYRQVCGEVEYALGEDIENVLDNAWEFCPGFDVKIIPRPLDKPHHGDGPLIDGVAHSFIGPGTINGIPCFRDFSLRHLVAHEVSHSYAKTVRKQAEKIISQSGSAEKVQKFARNQMARGYNGEMVLEETMMRAMQARYIDPFLDIDSASPDLALIKEHENYGMEHIFKFDRAIRRHKNNPKGTLAETVANLIIELA
jgi:hypothetical protein